MQDVNDVAAALLTEVGPVDTFKLQKLLYYSQAWHLAIFDEPLFEDRIEAWINGPVVTSVFAQHRGRRTVDRWPSGDRARLTKPSRDVVMLVCKHYGDLSGANLSTLTHGEAPWKDARGSAAPTAQLNEAIPTDAMKLYYQGQELAGRTSEDFAAGGIAGMSRRPLDEDDRTERREGLARIRAEYRRYPEPDERYSHPVIGRGQKEMPSEATLERVAKRRADRGL